LPDKYYLADEDEDPSGTTMAIDFDESEQIVIIVARHRGLREL
jgi:hypothetical protein